VIDEARKRELQRARMPEVTLSVRQVDQLELILAGWVDRSAIDLGIAPGPEPVALRDREGVLLAVLHAGGRIEGVERPHRYDFPAHRRPLAPGRTVAFAGRTLLHRSDAAVLAEAAKKRGAAPVILADASGEDYAWRVRCMAAAAEHVGARVLLAPLSSAGDLDAAIAAKLGVELLERPAPSIGEAELERLLDRDLPFPADLTFPEVEAELRRRHPPLARRGFTVLFTGLSGSGKSTIANILQVRLDEMGTRKVTMLDGDIVRTHLSKGLGFSREDRDTNIKRIGFVAYEITKHGGVAICAPIAPYDGARKAVREMVSEAGGFALVHVSTPIEECERRDRKGLYAKARRGEIGSFTGVSDPYEAPTDAEVVVDTSNVAREDAADRVIRHLRSAGYVP
jgi:sulfate adenylyltransferase